jgi:hypothetical protein
LLVTAHLALSHRRQQKLLSWEKVITLQVGDQCPQELRHHTSRLNW